MSASGISGQIRAGIIGAGLIGQAHSMMLRRIADRSDGSVRVTAVADCDAGTAERLATRWPGARACTSAEEILRDDAIDAVWICTPTANHREICIAAADAGKHIFCEKPLAMNTADALSMAAAINRAGVIAQVGLVLRFSPVYTVIREMVTKADAGRLLAVTMRDDQDFPIRGVHNSAWRNDPAKTAGGTLVEHSVHDFDLMSWMFGPIRTIYCRTRNLSGAPGVEDFGATEFEFASGINGQLTSIWHRMIGRPSNRRMEVFAENLFVACDHDVTGSITVQRGDAGAEDTISEAEVMDEFGKIVLRERPYLAPFSNCFAIPYALEDAAFLSALRGECEAEPAFVEGIAAQRLVEIAYESGRLGAPVNVSS